MCHLATCKTCGKATWRGCGMHVQQVMAGIPKSDRCAGHEAEPRTSVFGRLFGRRD